MFIYFLNDKTSLYNGLILCNIKSSSFFLLINIQKEQKKYIHKPIYNSQNAFFY